MNKKFFAALSAAALLLSASPLPALANEEEEVMIELESSGTGGTTSGIGQGTTTGSVAINEKNFPDKALRDGLYNKANVAFGQSVDKDNLDDKTLVNNEDQDKNIGPQTAADVTTIVIGPNVKDLSGIEYCTNATVVVMGASQMRVAESYSTNSNGGALTGPVWDDITNAFPPAGDMGALASNVDKILPTEKLNYVYASNNYISSLDLSALTKLEAVFIGGYNNTGTSTNPTLAAVTGVPTANPVQFGNNALTSVTLPETDTLNQIVVLNNKSLPTLDLSAASDATVITVSNNNVSSLTLPETKTLINVNVSKNNLGSLDASSFKNLKYLNVSYNNIYDLKVPTSLITLNASANILKEFDASELENLIELNLENNMLQSLILPEENNLKGLTVTGNHLASLNIEDVMDPNGSVGYTVNVGSQTIYVNEDEEAINLLEYDPNFERKNVIKPANTIEKDNILALTDGKATYTYQTYSPAATTYGAGSILTVTIKPADLMNRLYNPNSGEHFYTKDLNEKDTLVKLGWEAEGIGWVAPMASESNIPVYRLYNPNAGDHHYTKDSNERDTLVRVGWDNEGIGWYSAPEAGTNVGQTTTTTQVYREYNPNAKAAGAHNYTINPVENDALVSIGWMDEGIAWWANK